MDPANYVERSAVTEGLGPQAWDPEIEHQTSDSPAAGRKPLVFVLVRDKVRCVFDVRKETHRILLDPVYALTLVRCLVPLMLAFSESLLRLMSSLSFRRDFLLFLHGGIGRLRRAHRYFMCIFTVPLFLVAVPYCALSGVETFARSVFLFVFASWRRRSGVMVPFQFCRYVCFNLCRLRSCLARVHRVAKRKK